jgi:hypothetical protein
MAWGLIPVCTPQSGYVGLPGVVNVPLGDAEEAAAILRELQAAPEADLRSWQRANWEALDEHYGWDRFASHVAEYIDSREVPTLGEESTFRRLRLTWAAWSSYHTSPIRHWAALGRGQLRAWARSAAGSRRKGPVARVGQGPDEDGPGAPDDGAG